LCFSYVTSFCAGSKVTSKMGPTRPFSLVTTSNGKLNSSTRSWLAGCSLRLLPNLEPSDRNVPIKPQNKQSTGSDFNDPRIILPGATFRAGLGDEKKMLFRKFVPEVSVTLATLAIRRRYDRRSLCSLSAPLRQEPDHIDSMHHEHSYPSESTPGARHTFLSACGSGSCHGEGCVSDEVP
jgi:hypothetical protein